MYNVQIKLNARHSSYGHFSNLNIATILFILKGTKQDRNLYKNQINDIIVISK